MIDYYKKVKEVKHVSSLEELNELLRSGEWIIHKPIFNSDFEGGYELHKVK